MYTMNRVKNVFKADNAYENMENENEPGPAPLEESDIDYSSDIPTRTPAQDREDQQQLTMAFFLNLHNILLMLSYVLIIGNTSPRFSLTFLTILIALTHLVLIELLLRGLRKQHLVRIFPWFLVSFIEELIVISLVLSHLSTTYEELEGSMSQLFQIKGGMMILIPLTLAIRVVIWVKVFYKCIRYKYQTI